MAGLRRRAYRYAVIEYEKRTAYQKTTEHPVSIALRLTPRLLYGEATQTLDSAVETLKLRDGLMNKRQATLLAEHLNSKLGPDRYDTWRVVEGPESDGNARKWLDALGSTYQLMRRESGETAAWELGGAATRGIATFRVEQSPTLSSHQVFSSLPPRVVLPPRYLLACVSLEDETRYLAPDQYSWVGMRRLHPSVAATELFQLVTASNLLPAKPEAHHWEHSLRGFFYDQPPPHDDCSEYAHGFTAEEAVEVQDILKRNGYGDFEPARIGGDGNFNPLGFSDIVGAGKLVVPGQTPVEFFSYRG